MPKHLFTILALTTSISMFADEQCDVILTTKNFQIPCIITAIDENAVQYSECPYVIAKQETLSISNIKKIYLYDGRILDYTQDVPPIVPKIERHFAQIEHQQIQDGSLTEDTIAVQVQKQREVAQSAEDTDINNLSPTDTYDIIITSNATKIEAKILEVSKKEIKYKEKDNINGLTFVLETKEISSIIYSNGKVVLYNQQTAMPNNATSQTVMPKLAKNDKQNCECSQIIKGSGKAYTDWNKWLDYINIVKDVDIYKYRTLYLFPIDISQVRWPEESDNQYPALTESIKAFPDIIKELIQSKYRHLNVIIIKESEDVQMDESSIGLCLRFDELDMGNRALRFWIGFGAGAQNITLSGIAIDNAKYELFDFRHKRVTVAGRRKYEVSLRKEFINFSEDICRIFENM